MHVERNAEDQHVTVRFAVYGGPNTLRIHVRNDFGLAFSPDLPPLGEPSQGLRIVSETWRPTSLTVNISGISGRIYDLSILNPHQVTSVDGAELVRHGAEITGLRIRLPGTDSSSYITGKVVFHFSAVSSAFQKETSP